MPHIPFSNHSNTATTETPEIQRKNNVFNIFLFYNRTFTYCHIVFFKALSIFEHKGGNVPISFFSHPLMVVSNETRNHIHGTIKVVKSIELNY